MQKIAVTIEDIERWDIKEGDTICFRIPPWYSKAMIETMKKKLFTTFEGIDVKFVFLPREFNPVLIRREKNESEHYSGIKDIKEGKTLC